MRLIFWVFCINWILIYPLHYLSSRSDFGFEFAEIFGIEKRLPDCILLNSILFYSKSMVIVHYIPSLFFAKLVLLMAGLAV